MAQKLFQGIPSNIFNDETSSLNWEIFSFWNPDPELISFQMSDEFFLPAMIIPEDSLLKTTGFLVIGISYEYLLLKFGL